jgi:DNA-binding response OmpR family regulator
MTPTILVVEDEPDLAATCQRLLSRRGWRVLTVGTRDGGLTALAGTLRLALAIVDRRLPDGDGFDVLRAARAAGTPVIIVTGFGSPSVRQSALEEGAAGFLAKPFSARELVDLVQTIAGNPAGLFPPSAESSPPRT